MDVSQAVTFKLGHTQPKGEKTQPTNEPNIKNKALHAVKSGTMLNHNKAMDERMVLSSTNTLKYI